MRDFDHPNWRYVGMHIPTGLKETRFAHEQGHNVDRVTVLERLNSFNRQSEGVWVYWLLEAR